MPASLPLTTPKEQKSANTSETRFAFLADNRIIAALSVFGIGTYLVLRYLLQVNAAQAGWVLLAVLAIGGIPLVVGLIRRVLAGEFGSDILAGLSIATSAILGEFLAGAIIVLMLSGGTALEEYATRRASSVLRALARRMPLIAHQQHGNHWKDVDVSEIRVGERLVVLPHEICPADGVVVEGRGVMDESYLTGEPFQIEKISGASVLSGALNGDAVLTISVARLPSDSRYSKIMRVMQEAEANRPRMRRVADRLGAWYTALALGIAAAAWAISHDASRFLAVLVIATPCPLLLAIPVAIIGAISMAAARGIVIKDPGMLERIDTCRTIIFDKTGTLTYGKPALTDVLPAPGYKRADVLALAASLEQYSKHPLAPAVLQAARDETISVPQAGDISERPGEGLNGAVRGMRIQITSRKKIAALGVQAVAQLPPTVAGMECILLVDGDYAGALRFRDAPRKESRSFVQHLKPRHRVNRLLLLSGDRDSEVRYLAEQVGIANILSNQSPEEKVAVVKAEAARQRTAFVGDGINDAPAMQAATVGIAFGRSSDITAEAADAVILEPSLAKVDELMHIGRRMRRIALQSAIGGMSLSGLGMLAAAAGHLPPVAGAIAQEAIDVLAVLNALRMVLPAGRLRDEGL